VTNLGPSGVTKWSAVVAVVVALGVPLSPPAQAAQASTDIKGTIVVSAAASLTDSFKALAREFRRTHSKVRVTFNFGSSSALISQIQAGAPADVFAAADTSSIDKLSSTGQVNKSPRIFARNSLSIVVKRGNPLGVKSLTDMSKARVISLCAKTAPCGVYAASALQRARVSISESKVTRGVDAKATLGAVMNGDADAAIVYSTDALSSKNAATVVTIPQSQNVTAMYSIAPIRGSKNARVAQLFVDFVMSARGQKILSTFGFLKA